MADEKWDVEQWPMHMRGDVHTRNQNIDKGKKLCERCTGTGNELYSMYKECKDCNGNGYKDDEGKENNYE